MRKKINPFRVFSKANQEGKRSTMKLTADQYLISKEDKAESAAFVEEKKQKKIGIKSSLIEYAALKRNLEVERLNRRMLIIKSRNGESFAFHNMNGNSSSAVGKAICNSKTISRDIFRKNGISVIESKKFTRDSFENALKYVEKIGYPVVVKPISLSRGRGITTNIKNSNELRTAWNSAFAAYNRPNRSSSVLIERHMHGEDFRFYVVGDMVLSATHRKRAHVIGDGHSNLLTLIKKKNKERSKNPYLSGYPIPENIEELDRLKKNNMKFESIPKESEEVILRSQSNLSAGGDSIDVTDEIHPDYHEIITNVVKSTPGMEYAGVDVITPDITKKPTNSNYIIGEIEYSPAPITHFPFKGKERDMAGALIDYYLQKYDG